jgi:hypothetical protein
MDHSAVVIAVAKLPLDAAARTESIPASPAVEPLAGIHAALVATGDGLVLGSIAAG